MRRQLAFVAVFAVLLAGACDTASRRRVVLRIRGLRKVYDGAGRRGEAIAELPLRARGLDGARRRALAAEALGAVGLHADHVPDAYPWQLSGGMQQRVAIARA